MADANPGIGGLSAATRLTLEEFRRMSAAGAAQVREPVADGDAPPGPVKWRAGRDRPPPNLGPPPPRLDWRKRRS